VAAYRALVIRISVGGVALPVEPLGVATLGRQGSYPGRTLHFFAMNHCYAVCLCSVASIFVVYIVDAAVSLLHTG
jgi:hypothetical protein